MHLSIIAPNGRLFNGTVDSVMLPGMLGPFQVLANHAPILSSLIAGKVTYALGAISSSISIKGGFTSVADNQVIVVCEPAL
ncbi:MAG: hypothetical protein NMK33_00265 [Candidatus Cardinium sp.]|uniref:hypothetical protein n=1 Tax=Cardinium endosymbiont of Dermatophagoides farinae TaxID=2597823 RepID=UPI001181DBB4|nr:hypothetical protein [Cardinium endosymbiont of Dermatophagoides farinae]TSJ80969.1 hypothetical protein FPG78_02945 [Cardinium endosymbiont of Dermatophagoides farinae]UWW96995.1 MAG: hypothetical protein NMK33_00265 [Candidatus Cardinium sp.]